ncbi:hypothetical protein SD10_11795 [Spirosoma radiotolerans]|uniref:prolyl oligopeptidase n=1 Tax=Spirosoma radiotolerans TaxID=1379870 RepID=A0A0E4A022_9BACT|nr:hypothetical protein SD10_11795 [Spirosoma radiotolerans]
MPVAPIRPVIDEYFGNKITDPYRWMEKPSNPELDQYLKGQGDYTRTTLDGLPRRKELLKHIVSLDTDAPSPSGRVERLVGDKYLYLKSLPGQQTPSLFLRKGLLGTETLLVDPSHFNTSTQRYSISYFVPSPDDNYIAYAIAANGSEKPTLHILNLVTRQDLPETIDRMDWEYARPEWHPDGHSFFYTRMRQLAADAPATEYQKKKQVFRHVLNTDPATDQFILGFGASPAVAINEADTPIILTLTHTPSPYILARIKHGDAIEETVYRAPLDAISQPNVPWQKIYDRSDLIRQVVIHEDWLYLMTSKEAPRFKIIRTRLSHPDLAHAQTILAPSEAVLDAMSPALDGLYISQMRGGLDQTLRVTWDGSPKPERIQAPNVPACFVAGTNHLLPGAFITSAAWTGNGLVYLYEPATGRFTDTGFAPKHPVEAKAGLESHEVLARAKDGTMVPLSIVYKRGLKLNGKNPTLLTGYGSYGRIAYPYFNPLTVAWFDRGGVYAVAHVRGGGENGQEWHTAGQKLNKPNTWNDFIACAEYLIGKGYTASRYLAGEGTSAGGIMIGRAITERPDLFKAAIINVGMLDAVRFETTANGVPNIQEFGTATDSLGFRGLYQMSAVHHVKDGTRYPAVLLTTGINDRRVEPWQSAKMAARLQAASTSGKPILLRVDSRSGHGAGLGREQEQAKLADTYAFLLDQLTGRPD